MKPLVQVSGVAAPIDAENVDTDQIIPARFLLEPRSAGYENFLFHDLRATSENAQGKEFVLNREVFRMARILVANTNFGCGSAREHACFALVDYGIQAVVAPSFGGIFRRNCTHNGIAAVEVTARVADEIRSILWRRPGVELCVDIDCEEVLLSDRKWAARLPSGARERLLNGTDDIDLTLRFAAALEAFEEQHLTEWPWVSRGSISQL